MLDKKSLIIYTSLVLLVIGAVSIYGIYLYQENQSRSADWTSTQEYLEYVDYMNLAATPPVAAVMVLLTVCIPRRLLNVRNLVTVAGAIIVLSAAAAVPLNLVAGLTLLLSATAGVQSISLVETLRGSEMDYRKKGHVAHVGSALLHLGVVLLLLDLTSVPKHHEAHLTLFWASTAFFMAGMVLSFFPAVGNVFYRENRINPQP
ncbi:MAG: hypothetical protein MAG715_00718 [Methanonatronarchaeales archaeon]|nr:hypothetical protein [Methanonatronarchaeales archaeon]